MKYKISEKFKKLYRYIINILDPKSYRIIECNDKELEESGFPQLVEFPHVTVWACTWQGENINYSCGKFEIPKDSPIIQRRLIRYCEHDGKPHFNADDHIFFEIKSREVISVSLPKHDSKDHYISIDKFQGVDQFYDIYHLPREKTGSIDTYIQNRALIPRIVNFERIKNE